MTTYEGNHNHPLPRAAMAMASTTSAATAMLLSGSTASNEGPASNNSALFPSIPYAPTVATLSASAPFPTITLDLTRTPNSPMQIFPRTPLVLPISPPTFPFPFPLHGHSQHLGLGFGHTKYSDNSSHQPELPALSNTLLGQRQASLIETVTAAFASDPNFTAALAEAISKVIGVHHGSVGGSNGGNENSSISGIKPVLPGSPQLPQSCNTFSAHS